LPKVVWTLIRCRVEGQKDVADRIYGTLSASKVVPVKAAEGK
jgi:hypothetical protein